MVITGLETLGRTSVNNRMEISITSSLHRMLKSYTAFRRLSLFKCKAIEVP